MSFRKVLGATLIFGIVTISASLALPTTGSNNVASFVDQPKSIEHNDFANFDIEDFDANHKSHVIRRSSDVVLDGIVEQIRTNLNNVISREIGPSRLHKKDTSEQSNSQDNAIDDHNHDNHSTGHVHKINTPEDIKQHHMIHNSHPVEHHEKTVETEQERLEVNESLGFRVLEFFGSIAGLVWGVFTNVTRLFAGSATAASGSSSSSSSA